MSNKIKNISPYERVTWKNGEGPALNEENLNKSEEGLEDLTAKVNEVIDVLNSTTILAGDEIRFNCGSSTDVI